MNKDTATSLELMAYDLAASGLVPQDMLTRVLDEASRAAIKANSLTKGYVIPYFNMYAKMGQYYRAKVFNIPEPSSPLKSKPIKYLQLPLTPNHVYFPKNFMEVYSSNGYKICLMTEGEKKAALCCKVGIPCIAFSGVDSWRNRTIILPRDSETFNYSSKFLGVKLPVSNFDESTLSTIALGLAELIDIGLHHKTTFIIVYDRDGPQGVATAPQRAAARLGFELRQRGLPTSRIRQLVPPSQYADKEGRTTLEDIILKAPGKLEGLIEETLHRRVAFPRHPVVKEYVAKMLQRPGLNRKDMQAISLAILTELDSRGRRMYSTDTQQMFYFDHKSHHLMKVDLNVNQPQAGQESEFGRLLYRDYGISLAGDSGLIKWLGTHFAGEEPLELVSPFRILGRPNQNEDAVRYQINDGEYIKVSGDLQGGIQILSNGSENTLFESRGGTESNGVTSTAVTIEINKQIKHPIRNHWREVLNEVRLPKVAGHDRLRDTAAYLCYLSPWLMRWRGLQLPVEIVTGEAGSGKSTLYEVRLSILTGEPTLRNAPNDIKDWNASVANSGALHVTDNVQFSDKILRQRISDELCRLVTEPKPRIQMRKLYTDSDEISIHANMAFAFTSIQAPFTNPDILQRSIYLELSKSMDASLNDETSIFEANFRDRQLSRFGGRTAWIAHHMIVLHNFFKLVKTEWDPKYKAKHRLVGLEQSMILMARVFGDKTKGVWIPDFLQDLTNRVISSSEWAMEGLLDFARYIKQRQDVKYDTRKHKDEPYTEILFGTQEIAQWVESKEDYAKCRTINNSRTCAKYMSAHRYNIAHITGIVEAGMKNNRQMYKLHVKPRTNGTLKGMD